MRTAMKMMTVYRSRISSQAVTHESYLRDTIQPLVHLRCRETTGTNAVNDGTLGADCDGTISGGVTLGQAGVLGLNEAFDFDGLTGQVAIPANAAINTLQAATYGFLIHPDTLGEVSAGRIFDAGAEIITFASSNRITVTIPGSGGNATITTNNDFITLAEWAYLFVTYNYGSDRLIRAYLGNADGLAEATYGTQTAGTGTKTENTGGKYLGNNAATTRSFDGPIDEAWVVGRVITPTEMLEVVTLANPT